MQYIKTNKWINKCPVDNEIIAVKHYDEYGNVISEGERKFGFFVGICFWHRIYFEILDSPYRKRIK